MLVGTFRLLLFIAVVFAFASPPALFPAFAQDRSTKAMDKFDRDNDGKISRQEWRKSKDAFDRMDTDSDGFLSLGELRKSLAGKEDGEVTADKKKDEKATPSQASVSVQAPTPQSARVPADMPALYLVDAHSQMARGLNPDVIVPLMDKAGVWHTILSARNDRNPSDVADFAAANPDRITAAVRTKGRAFNDNTSKYAQLLEGQLKVPVFKAMAEVILYHAEKGRKAPEIKVSSTAPQTRTTLTKTIERGWPFIAHYEFAAAGWGKDKIMTDFEAMAHEYPDHPFVLIHMGQLDADEAGRLIVGHPNVYFITSHANPVSIAKNPGQPWSRLFEGDGLAPPWRALIEAHPDRFVLGFDNVWPEYWGDFYLKQVEVWRKALAALPPEVARAVAHGNAERLWNLTPKPN
jgi:predicted TIM-barrel fold metal-dependent hydrolase